MKVYQKLPKESKKNIWLGLISNSMLLIVIFYAYGYRNFFQSENITIEGKLLLEHIAFLFLIVGFITFAKQVISPVFSGIQEGSERGSRRWIQYEKQLNEELRKYDINFDEEI